MDGRVGFAENKQNWSIYNKVNFVALNARISEEFKEYSYRDFKNHVNFVCQGFFLIFYICYGVLQFFATRAGLVKVFHHDNVIIQLASLVLGFFPVVGTFSGLCGAHIGWGWDLSYSSIVFISPYFLPHLPLFILAIFDIYGDSRYLHNRSLCFKD